MSLPVRSVPGLFVRWVRRTIRTCWRRFALPRRPSGAAGSRARHIPIHTNTITLGAFLKWAGLVNTGGGAKALIAARSVCVNGVIEVRRGRQLRPRDRVDVHGGPMLVVVKGNDAAATPSLAPRVS
ncbi:MAG: RNA-binding S4 domain-containing protein [bacterium]